MVDLKGIRERRIFEDTQKLASSRIDVDARVGSEDNVEKKRRNKGRGA